MATMAQEWPTNFSTSFPNELGFVQENEIPGIYHLERPEGLHAKTTVSERDESVSPANQRDSHSFDTLDDDDNYKNLLFTFPRLYSDLTSDKDPFFDRGMPLNPHNTPISLSGNQSELGFWQKDTRHAQFSLNADKTTPNRVHNTVPSNDEPLTSLFNCRKARPPRTPKPSFLSDIDIPCSGEAENIPPVLGPWPIDQFERRTPRPETPYRSLPLRTGRNVSHYTEHSNLGQALEPRPARPKQSWETRSIIPCRYFSRPFPSHELEILGIPLNNPDMPFPASIPTVDNLPLRRGIIDFDWEGEDKLPADTDDSTATQAKQTTSSKALSIWRLPQQVFSFGRVAKNILHSLPWRKERATAKENSILRTDMLVPRLSRREMLPMGPESASIVDDTGGTCVLEINIVFPLPYLNRITAIVAFIRGCMPSRVGQKVLFLLWKVFELALWWLFAVLRIEVDAELRSIRENQCGLMYM